MRNMSWLQGGVIQSEWYLTLWGGLWAVLKKGVFANVFGWMRYVAQAWKDENNIVAQLSLRE